MNSRPTRSNVNATGNKNKPQDAARRNSDSGYPRWEKVSQDEIRKNREERHRAAAESMKQRQVQNRSQKETINAEQRRTVRQVQSRPEVRQQRQSNVRQQSRSEGRPQRQSDERRQNYSEDGQRRYSDERQQHRSDVQQKHRTKPTDAKLKSQKRTNTGKQPKKKKNNGRKKLWIGVVGIVMLAMLFFGAWKLFYNHNLKPVGDSTESVIVEIPNGSTVSDVADILKENGLIRNAMVFRSYASRRCDDEHQIQAANYEFNPSMSCEEILDKMFKGDAYLGEVKITVTEGMRLSEIAALLEKNHVCSEDAFKKECSNLKKYQAKYPILSSIPTDQNRDLEGYLYPATYYWDSNTDPATVVADMVDCFVDAFSSELQDRAKEMEKSVDEIIIMASIIEGEIKLEEDKANCASVLYNRLKADMPLQVDSTINYALGKNNVELTSEELQMNSPYNTYVNYGLPPGPISSPGMASIKAALFPASTKYLYFVSNIESGKTYFNETFEGHEADVEKYMK